MLQVRGRSTTFVCRQENFIPMVLHAQQSRPQSPRPLDQRSGSAWALVESKTRTRKSWFRFDSARASEIVFEMNKFQQPMRFGRFFWRAFSLAQRSRFLAQSRRIAGSGDEIACPVEEWMLCLFVFCFLADSIQHASIKVYLSAIRFLHIYQGFSDSLLNCLCLQQVIRGIKWAQGSPVALRLLSDTIMAIIRKALDTSLHGHCIFWAAYTLDFLGFLRSAKFTVLNLASYSSDLHLMM